MFKELKPFILRLGIRQECPISFNIVLDVLAKATRQEKEIRGIQIEKEETKLISGGNNIYRKPLMTSQEKNPKLLELINEFNKVTGYKGIIQNQLYFYVVAMKNLKKIKTIPFTIASKIIKIQE